MKVEVVVNRISNPASVTQSQAQVRLYYAPNNWIQLGIGTGNTPKEAKYNALDVASVAIENIAEQCIKIVNELE